MFKELSIDEMMVVNGGARLSSRRKSAVAQNTHRIGSGTISGLAMAATSQAAGGAVVGAYIGGPVGAASGAGLGALSGATQYTVATMFR